MIYIFLSKLVPRKFSINIFLKSNLTLSSGNNSFNVRNYNKTKAYFIQWPTDPNWPANK